MIYVVLLNMLMLVAVMELAAIYDAVRAVSYTHLVCKMCLPAAHKESCIYPALRSKTFLHSQRLQPSEPVTLIQRAQ